MRAVRVPSLIARGRCLRILVAFCLLVMGLGAHGICIEPDGVSHVASSGHLCCDPPLSSPTLTEIACVGGEDSSSHDCTHLPLLESTCTSSRLDREDGPPALWPCEPPPIEPLMADAQAFQVPSAPLAPASSPLSTVRLRL